jgi:hypothetical protein
MSDFSNKNKTITTALDEYNVNLYNKCEEKSIKQKKSVIKITNENIIFPTITNYNEVLQHNYNASQLKIFAKHYKLKLSGNKKELFNRIYGFLHLSFYIIKIQKIFRGFLRRKYNALHGPAYKNRKMCNNQFDFITMEPVEEINVNQFISYMDVDNFIYGFDISSLYNMIVKHNETKNPYNRNNIPEFVIKNIKTMSRFSKILNESVSLNVQDDIANISNEKTLELRALSLFQTIDSLGNYSDPQWFLSLSRGSLIKLVRELADIWNYRAQLTAEVKYNICPPHGDPFRIPTANIYYLQTESNIDNIKKSVLEVLEKMVNSGVDRDSKSLGAYYVLGAITLVNTAAATALPWLYQSVCYF